MVAELKSKIINRVQSVENEAELEMYYQVIQAIANQAEGNEWSELSKHHKKEILASYGESKNNSLLISHEEAKQKLKRWL